MKKNKWARITAIIALIAIVASIIWTWVLIIYETVYWPNNQQISQEELNKLLEQYNNSWSNLSWSTLSGSSLSWSINLENLKLVPQDLTWTWIKK